MTFPDTALTDAFRSLMPRPVRTSAPVRPAMANFGFGGGGTALVAANADPFLLEIPFACRIMWAHLYAGDASGQPVLVTATVDLRLTQLGTFGTSIPVYGTGTMPTLTAQSAATLSLAGWHIDLDAGDTLIAMLRSFSGTATWVALTLMLRPTGIPVNASAITDGGNVVTDSSGNVVIMGG